MNIDYGLLKQQKSDLLYLTLRHEIAPYHDTLMGVIHLLDYLEDMHEQKEIEVQAPTNNS